MNGTNKGNPTPSVYVRGPAPLVQDAAAFATWVARELQKIEAATRRLDERLTAGHL